MVNKPLIRPYFWGGYVGGGRLTSHDDWKSKDVEKKKLAGPGRRGFPDWAIIYPITKW